MYIGSDGKLVGAFFDGNAADVVESPGPVDDGKWHFAVLAADSTGQALYLDGTRLGTLNAGLDSADQWYEYIGAGFLGGGWPDEPHNDPGNDTGYASYFNGDIAEAAWYHASLTVTQVASQWKASKYSATAPLKPPDKPAATWEFPCNFATSRLGTGQCRVAVSQGSGGGVPSWLASGARWLSANAGNIGNAALNATLLFGGGMVTDAGMGIAGAGLAVCGTGVLCVVSAPAIAAGSFVTGAGLTAATYGAKGLYRDVTAMAMARGSRIPMSGTVADGGEKLAAEDLGNGTFRYPDGSIRTADGKFAGSTGGNVGAAGRRQYGIS